MEILAALIAGGSIFLLSAYVIRARALHPSEARLRYLTPRESVVMEEGPDGKMLLRRDASSIPALSRLLSGSSYAARWLEELERADLRLRVGEYLALRLMLALVGFVVTVAIARGSLGVLGGIAVGAVAFMLPAYWLRFRTRRRTSKIESQILETITLIANGVRAGFAFPQAMAVAAERIESPMSAELNRVLADVNLGANLEDALTAMNDRINSDDLDMVVTAILIQRSTGGNLAEVLENVTRTMRDREHVQGEIRTMTSQQRLTAWILTLWPVALGLLFALINPSMMKLMFTTDAGRVLLVVWLTLCILAGVTYRKILDIDV